MALLSDCISITDFNKFPVDLTLTNILRSDMSVRRFNLSTIIVEDFISSFSATIIRFFSAIISLTYKGFFSETPSPLLCPTVKL